MASLPHDPGRPMPLLSGPSEWLHVAARHRGHVRAVVDRGMGRTVDFAELDARVSMLTNRLLDVGVRPGDRLAVLAADSHQYLETVLACTRAGFSYVPLNVRLAPPEIERLVVRSDASILFVDESHRSAARAAAGAPALRRTITYSADRGLPGGYEAFVSGASEIDPGLTVDPATTMIGLAFTSGTTGDPKGVLQPLSMMINTVVAGLVEYDIAPDDVRYAAAPMFHIAGLVFSLIGIARGIPSLVLPQFDPDEVLHSLQHGEITGAFLVPTMISMLLERPGVGDCDYPDLRNILYGAAPITPALLRRAVDTFKCDFIQLFGAGTEAGLQCVMSAADHRRALAGHEHLLTSVGRPAFGVSLRVVDDDLADVPDGTVGELATRSDQMMAGYLDDPESTAEALRGGWFRAGDLGRLDGEGYVYLAGRSKDMIVRGGENIFPIEIETVLMRHPDLVDVAVVGIADEHWGETVQAFAVRRVATVDASELTALCREHLAPHKVPVEFHWLDELPRNAAGKVLKRRLRGEPD